MQRNTLHIILKKYITYFAAFELYRYKIETDVDTY
jgi:hypothetical protein